jgi:hypothetical protein
MNEGSIYLENVCRNTTAEKAELRCHGLVCQCMLVDLTDMMSRWTKKNICFDNKKRSSTKTDLAIWEKMGSKENYPISFTKETLWNPYIPE